MASTAPVADAPRATGDPSFGGLVQIGETLVAAVKRLESGKDYARIIASENGQRLLEAINAQARDARNGKGRAPAKKLTAEEAPAQAAADAAAEVAQALEVLAVASIAMIPIASIDIGTNVRINVAGLDELTASIQEHGVLQPIKVRPAGDRFTIVWGQRRFLASRQAGLTAIPAIVDVEDKTTSVLAIEQLVENLHRADLPPLDRARAMRAVVDAGMSQVDLARELGIHTSTISNDLGLLEAPPAIQKFIETGELSPSHAKALKGLAPKTQAEVARRVMKDGLSAHATEELVQREKRQAEQESENRQRQAKASAATRAQLEASLVEQSAAKKVPADALIVVGSGYGGDAATLVGLLHKAGFANARAAKGWNEIQARPSGGVCDCTAWKAAEHTTTYSKRVDGFYAQTSRVSFTKGCIDRKHQATKDAAAEATRRAKEAVGTKVQQHVRQGAFGVAIPPTSGDTPLLIGIPRILAEAALWDVLSYRLPEWSVAHGGKREKPWTAVHALTDEDLAKELAMELARDFRDKAGYHVDWAALAGELGLEDAPAAADAAAAKGKKAAAS